MNAQKISYLVEFNGGRVSRRVVLTVRPGVRPPTLDGIAKRLVLKHWMKNGCPGSTHPTPLHFAGVHGAGLAVTARDYIETVEVSEPRAAAEKPISRKLRGEVPHGVSPEIVVTLYPRGIIGLRENRRSKSSEVTFDVGALYVAGLQARIRAEKAAKRKERKARKGAK